MEPLRHLATTSLSFSLFGFIAIVGQAPLQAQESQVSCAQALVNADSRFESVNENTNFEGDGVVSATLDFEGYEGINTFRFWLEGPDPLLKNVLNSKVMLSEIALEVLTSCEEVASIQLMVLTSEWGGLESELVLSDSGEIEINREPQIDSWLQQ
jgi:hypothetical protein